MLNINEIGINAMIHARDHKTPYLIDPWDYRTQKTQTFRRILGQGEFILS